MIVLSYKDASDIPDEYLPYLCFTDRSNEDEVVAYFDSASGGSVFEGVETAVPEHSFISDVHMLSPEEIAQRDDEHRRALSGVNA